MTGLPEDVILWELPMSRGYAYLHVSLVRDGIDIRWGNATEDDDVIKKARAMLKGRN